MLTLRKCLIPLLLALLLLVSASSAYGDEPPANPTETVRETVSWSIPAGQCPSLPSGLSLSGTGDRLMVINTQVNPDGSSQTVVNDLVKGDAVDSNGDTYHFLYQNHSTTSVPASGAPIQIDMSDSFVLNGRGAAGNLTVGFVWSWTYTPPAEFWPPADNWQQVNTRGEPFLCDPI